MVRRHRHPLRSLLDFGALPARPRAKLEFTNPGVLVPGFLSPASKQAEAGEASRHGEPPPRRQCCTVVPLYPPPNSDQYQTCLEQGRRSARYYYLIIGPGPFFIRGRWIIKALGARQTAQGAPTYVAVGNSPEQVPDPRPNRCGTLDITT